MRSRLLPACLALTTLGLTTSANFILAYARA